MNILSLFDGMSCGQIALNRAGVKYSNYYASEIDTHAIKVTQHNYPKTTQLGDVRKIQLDRLPKIDLLIGGSPCQGFSYSGKGLNFDDPRSKLFFEFVKILKTLNPKYFMLENVKMEQVHIDTISEYLKTEPVMINSSLVSAQNRKRLYWTNIPSVNQPRDKGVVLSDIIASYSGKTSRVNDNARVKKITENDRGYRPHRGDIKSTGISELGRILKAGAKTDTLTTSHAPKVAMNKDVKDLIYRKLTPVECERLQTVPDNYTNIVSDRQRLKMLGNGWTVDVIAHILKGIL